MRCPGGRAEPAVTAGPILAGILAVSSAEGVLERAFIEAQRRGTALRVLIAGPAATIADPAVLGDPIERWAEKHPDVPLTVATRPGLDAAITLTAATRRCGLAMAARPADPCTAAVLRAVARRAHCPLVIV